MKISDIFDAINTFAPFSKALDFDNVGLLVGNGEREVTRVVISLDITSDVISQANAVGAELIVSHHPVIFHPLERLSENDCAYLLAKNGIAAICAHTSYDIAEDGVNDALARVVGITGELSWLSANGTQAIGRVGDITEIAFDSYALLVKKALGSQCVRAVGKGNVKRVAVVGGSGGDMLETALECGADTLVTGELKYNHFLDAARLGLNVIEAGHFATENPSMKPLKLRLEKLFPTVKFIEAVQTEGYRII